MILRRRLLLLLTLLTLAVPPAALSVAQEEPEAGSLEAGEHELLTDSRELLADIEDEQAEINDLRRERDASEGEDALVIERRLMRKGYQILQTLDALVENVVALEEAEVEAEEIRTATAGLLETVSQLVRPRLELFRQRAADISARRREATEEERIDLDAQEAELDEATNRVFRAAMRNLGHMRALGLDTAGEMEYMGEILAERASMEMALAQGSIGRIAVIEERLASTPDDAALAGELTRETGRKDGAVANLQGAVQMMTELELETTEYQQFLIESTGELTTDILDTKVAVSLIQHWIARVQEWFRSSGPGLAFKAFVIILIFLVFVVLSRIVRKVTTRAVSSKKLKLSQLVREMIVTASGNTVLFLGLLVALSQTGLSLGPILAGLGIAGFVLGFALQEVLGNFAAGVMILIYRPFDVGDYIEAAGISGRVHAMSMVSTSIMTFDYQTLIVPNGKIWGNVINNFTATSIRRVDMIFGVSYSTDIPHTESVLASIMKEHPKVLEDPEPLIKVDGLGESSVNFKVGPWVKTDDYWDVYWDVTRAVKMRFDREGISIPFPQRDVHLYEATRSGPSDPDHNDSKEEREA